jgi:hypothetical protein
MNPPFCKTDVGSSFILSFQIFFERFFFIACFVTFATFRAIRFSLLDFTCVKSTKYKNILSERF